MDIDYIGGRRQEQTDGHMKDAGGGTGRVHLPLALQYWRIIMRWKWVVVGILAGALALGLVATLFMTPMYTSTSTVEISRQRDRVVNVQSVEPEVSAVDLEFYQTQYSLLQARSLAQRVVADLRFAETDELFDAFGVNPADGISFFEAENQRITAEQRAKRLKKATDILLDHISIAPVRNSSLVEVSFSSPNADLSRRIVTAWTKGFITSNLDRRFEASSYARKFLEDRLEQIRQRLEESERRVVAYASRERIVSIPAEQQGAAERSLVGDDLARLNAELVSATADRVRAASRLNSNGNTSVEALNNQTISTLRAKRAEAAAEYSKMLARFEPEYPASKAIASQIKDLDRSIANEEARVRDGISKNYHDSMSRENTLRAQLETLKNDALNLRRRSIQYNIYQRDADTNRQLYDGLLQRYKEIGVAGGIGSNNVLVVDAASLPDKPSSPRLVLNLAIALILGLIIAAAVVFILEQVDETIKDPLQVEPAFGLPNIGIIPLVEGEPNELLTDRKSALSEAYLSLQTNLRFSTHHGVPRSLAVTSTRPAEGKTTTSWALSQTLARIGKKVVLIDCDMRSPSLHHIMGINNERGVSDYLAGNNEIGHLITSSGITDLDLITAGPHPPSAAELLNGPRLHTLITALLERYDHVIIDSPPVIGLADAPLIGSQVEGVVYVIGANGAVTNVIRSAIARLQSAKANLLGITLTRYKSSHAYYGYDYGYGYGQNAKEVA
ncbi:polysaccharide biosynthesis tyrosine autokinase [Sphingomonas sp. C3-2]|uniref:GumC family protein n=1 Tax=Sphingomonas sp. C3-2 TaxID=3062169 RepID=UPI00294B3461|nr:polysaccharide biosynthesis tyrosine autokinase [Sphingomonas sp. C3-2]WOK35092.1 polysaccharide biosynthesis tyrosine autokinase [Sphingomonas sp. C3-2]